MSVFLWALFVLHHALPAQTTAPADPQALLQQAALLIQEQVHPRVHLLEFWGADLSTQAELAPEAQQAVDLLNQAIQSAKDRMNAVASTLKSPADPAIQQWQAYNRLEQGAQYTLHMTQYALALSMEPNDPRRQPLVEADIDYLQRFDTPHSGVQPLVRLRLARLQLLLKQYDHAGALLASLTSQPPSTDPPPTAAQQQDARCLQVIAALQQDDLKSAADHLPQRSPPATQPSQEASRTNDRILQYRLLIAQADHAASPHEKKTRQQQAHAVLASLLKDHPEYWPLARRRLIARAGEHPAIDTLDTLTLEAFLQRADVQRQTEHPDHDALEQGLAAARQLLQRKPADAQLHDQADILVPVILEKLGRDAEAARAFIAYADQPDGKYRQPAFSHAQWLTAKLLQADPKDSAAQLLHRQFLELAVLKLDKKSFAFDYARQLQSSGRFADAARYYLLTPTEDARYAEAQVAAIECLIKAARPDQAADQLADLLRDRPASPAAALLPPLLGKLDDQYADALSAQNVAARLKFAKARAVLSPLLVAQAEKSSDPNLNRDRLYNADCRRQLAELESPSKQRDAILQSLMGDYQSLSTDPACRARATLGLALINHALGNDVQCVQILRPLLESGSLGDGTIRRINAATGPSQAVDDFSFWIARYTLLKANWTLAAHNASARAAVRRDLNILAAKWGDGLGGQCYHLQFQALQKEVEP